MKLEFYRHMKYQIHALQSGDKDCLRECPVCSQVLKHDYDHGI